MLIDFSDPELYNPKFLPVFENLTRRYVFLMGGSGSGKSVAAAQAEVIASYEPGNRLLWVRKVSNTIKDSMFAQLEDVITDWWLRNDFSITTSPMRIVNKLTGSDMIFRGLDDVEKLKSVAKVTRVWFEEATEGEKGDHDQLDLRLRWIGRLFVFTCTFNPVSKNHWLVKDFWIRGTTENQLCIHSTYLDNRFVDPEQYSKVFERLKTQAPNLYLIYALGIPWEGAEGLVYSYETLPEVPAEAKKMGYGLDFGFNHPACLTGIHEWNGAIVLDQVFHRSGLLNPDIVERMREAGIGPDEIVVADNSRPEAIEEICQAGFACLPCKKGPDSVINGITKMKTYKIYLTARSDGMRKDFDNYVWAKDKYGEALDVPAKAFDDGPDAARYGAAYFFDFEGGDDVMTFIWGKKAS